MKTLCTALCALALATLATAATLTTSKGVTFQDYKVTAVEKEAVRIVHANGTATVDFDDLPSALQVQYGWTPEKSSARKTARNAAAVAKQKADEDARVAEERALKARQEAERVNAEHARIYAENAASAARRAEEQKRFNAEAVAKAEKDAKDRIELIAKVTVGVYLLFGFIFAFIPTFIARGKPQMGAVLFLNIISLLGGFGHAADDRIMAAAVYVVTCGIWITAFILALKPKPQGPMQIHVSMAPAPIPRQPRAIQGRTLPPKVP